jgi:hypothetical protein
VSLQDIERVMKGAQAAFQKAGIPDYWNSWEARKAVQQAYKTHHRQAVGSSRGGKCTNVPAVKTLDIEFAGLAAVAGIAAVPASAGCQGSYHKRVLCSRLLLTRHC